MSTTFNVSIGGLPAGFSIMECTEIMLSWNQPPPVNVSLWYGTSTNETAPVDSTIQQNLGIIDNPQMLWKVSIPPVQDQLFWFTAQGLENPDPISTSAMHTVDPGDTSCSILSKTIPTVAEPSVWVICGIVAGSISLFVAGVLVMIYVLHHITNRRGDRKPPVGSLTRVPTSQSSTTRDSTRGRLFPIGLATVSLTHTHSKNPISVCAFPS